MEIKKTEIKIWNREEYYSALIDYCRIARDGDRIRIFTHTLDVREELVKEILTALKEAASKGAIVDFALDERTFPIFQNGPLNRFKKDYLILTKNTLWDLKRAGVRVTILNKSFGRVFLPFAGRSHIKGGVFNDEILIGGCNLEGGDSLELTLALKDKQGADWLYDLLGEILKFGNTGRALTGKDRSYKIDYNFAILVDAGKKGKSLIFQEALRIVRQAKKEIIVASQFFPGGELGRALTKASKRGVRVKVNFNSPKKYTPILSFLVLGANSLEKALRPKELFTGQLSPKRPFLHVKLLASESEGIVGSHNFSFEGVMFGTAEASLLIKDKEVLKKVVEKAESFINE